MLDYQAVKNKPALDLQYENMKYDLFISYSRKDFEEVSALIEKIKAALPGISYWFDINCIESGDEFEDKIISAIDNSSYVLFALSENSIGSQWTKDEVMYAKNTDKKVIPVLLKGAQMKGWFLFKFGRVDCIDSTNQLQMDKLIRNLLDWTGHGIVQSSSTEPSVPKTTQYDTSQDPNIARIRSMLSAYKLESLSVSAEVDDARVLYKVVLKPGFRPSSLVNLHREIAICIGVTGGVKVTAFSDYAIIEVPKHVKEPAPVEKTWKVGDYYNVGGKEGVVFWVDKSGKHGKIVSMNNQTELQWCTNDEFNKGVTGIATDRSNGMNNLRSVMRIDEWRNKYPAFAWCADHGDGWYLPAIEELKELLLNDEVHSKVNGTLKQKRESLMYSKGYVRWYWSSTEEDKWRAWSVHMNDGSTYSTNRCYNNYVRAVSAF